MPFEKGNKHGKGREKGSVSKKTAIWNEVGEWFANDALEIYKEKVQAMLEHKDPSIYFEGMKRYEALLEYFKPKLSRTELKGDIKTTNIPVSEWAKEKKDEKD